MKRMTLWNAIELSSGDCVTGWGAGEIVTWKPTKGSLIYEHEVCSNVPIWEDSWNARMHSNFVSSYKKIDYTNWLVYMHIYIYILDKLAKNALHICSSNANDPLSFLRPRKIPSKSGVLDPALDLSEAAIQLVSPLLQSDALAIFQSSGVGCLDLRKRLSWEYKTCSKESVEPG